MAKAHRVPIGFQPATLAALEELAGATGQSISGLVSGFMDEAVPSFNTITQAIKIAKSKPIAALDLMAENLAVATHQASQISLDLVETRKRHNKRRVPK